MNDWTRKRKNSHLDFEARKERAIQKIKDKVIIATTRKKFQFTEKQLREEFEFDDIQRMYDKFDNFFTDGNFVLYPEEKIIEV